MEVEPGLDPLAVRETGILDVDPAEATGLDDSGLAYLDDAGRNRTAARHGTAQARTGERRKVGHELGGFMRGTRL
jgi:hypothetical protein